MDLLDLPLEILELVVRHVSLCDLRNLLLSCKALAELFDSSQLFLPHLKRIVGGQPVPNGVCTLSLLKHALAFDGPRFEGRALVWEHRGFVFLLFCSANSQTTQRSESCSLARKRDPLVRRIDGVLR